MKILTDIWAWLTVTCEGQFSQFLLYFACYRFWFIQLFLLDRCPTIVLPCKSLTHSLLFVNVCHSYQTKPSWRTQNELNYSIAGSVVPLAMFVIYHNYYIVCRQIFFSKVFSPFSAAGPIQAISSIALSLFWLKQSMRYEYQSKVMFDCETKIPNTKTGIAIKPNTKYQEQSVAWLRDQNLHLRPKLVRAASSPRTRAPTSKAVFFHLRSPDCNMKGQVTNMPWHNYKGGVLSKVKSILTNFIPGRRGTCQEGAAPVLCVTRRSWRKGNLINILIMAFATWERRWRGRGRSRWSWWRRWATSAAGRPSSGSAGLSPCQWK